MTLLTNKQWAEKFNAECQSKNAQFGPREWDSSDFNYDPEYDDPENFRNFCHQAYSTFSLCSSCETNIHDFLNSKVDNIDIKQRVERIEAFLSEKFPDFKDFKIKKAC